MVEKQRRSMDMSNKKLLSVLLVLPSILLCLSACSSPATDNGNQAPDSPGFPAIDYGYDLYEKCYAKATDAQKKQLESIQTEAFGVSDKQIVKVRLDTARALIFDDVVVRVSPSFAAAMHIDTDEANAAGCAGTVYGEILA